MNVRQRRIRFVPVISMILLLGVLVLWIRTREYGDIVGFYTPAGHLQALASDRAGVLIFLSEVPFGREYRLSADAMSVPADEFNQLHDWLYDKTREKWHFAGFRLAQGKLDLTASLTPKYSALIVPYWLLAAVLAAAPLGSFRRWLIRHGRRRRGQCLNCGYDLRHSTERCPECGQSICARRAQPVAGDARRTIIFPALLSLTAVAAVSGWLAFHRPHDAQPQALDPTERAAGLDRRIAQLHLSGVAFQKAIDEICAKSGVRIVVSPKLASMPLRVLDSIRVAPAQMGLGMPVDLDFQDVTVVNVLDVLIDQAQRQFAKPIGYTAAEDGTVVIAAEDELPRIVRAYDVRAVLKKLAEGSRAVLAEGSRAVRGRVFLGNVDVGDPRLLPPEQQLLELVMANRHTDFWIRPTGFRDPAWCAGGKLVVLETRRRHREIARILQRLTQLGPPWSG